MSMATGQPIGLGVGRESSYEPMDDGEQRWTLIAVLASVSALIAIYWNMFTLTKDYWSDDTYSHGWIIPFLGVFLMWSQRNPRGGQITREQENKNLIHVGIPLAIAVGCYFAGLYAIGWVAYAAAIVVAMWVLFRFHEFEPMAAWERWIGVALISIALATRIYATHYDYMPLDRLSFLAALFGVFTLAGGLPLIKKMWASIGFFVFMFPLPSAVEQVALANLQKVAAMASTTVLQVIGVVAHRQGNKIIVDGLAENLYVAEACSGLRMLTIFCAMSIAMVLLVQRPWWDKLILLLSAVPIALATNIIRITVTALLYKAVEGTAMQETLHEWIHDYAGYAMIIIAFGIMWTEYKLLTWLFVEEGEESLQATSIMGRGQARAN